MQQILCANRKISYQLKLTSNLLKKKKDGYKNSQSYQGKKLIAYKNKAKSKQAH